MSEDVENTGQRREPQTEPTRAGTPVSGEEKSEQGVAQIQAEKPGTRMAGNEDVVWVRITPSQVVRTVVIALLSAAVVLGALCYGRYAPLSAGASSPSSWQRYSTQRLTGSSVVALSAVSASC